MADCLFCRIVAGEIPATVVAESEHTLAFADINPQAPTHVLVIPKEHLPDVAALAARPDLLAAVVAAAAVIGDHDWRLVFNTGAGVGQSVFHVHAHVLAGRQLETLG